MTADSEGKAIPTSTTCPTPHPALGCTMGDQHGWSGGSQRPPYLPGQVTSAQTSGSPSPVVTSLRLPQTRVQGTLLRVCRALEKLGRKEVALCGLSL